MTTITDKLADKARAVTAYGDERTLRIAIDELRTTLAEYDAQHAQQPEVNQVTFVFHTQQEADDFAKRTIGHPRTFAQQCHDFADDAEADPQDYATGAELPLSDPYLQDKRFDLITDSQDVYAVVRNIAPGSEDIPSGVLVRIEGCDYAEVWSTYSARPFDLNVARYTRVR